MFFTKRLIKKGKRKVYITADNFAIPLPIKDRIRAQRAVLNKSVKYDKVTSLNDKVLTM
jgi:hypothetical protein